MADKTIDVVCKRCGQTFAVFLKDMAEHNAKIACPTCGAVEVEKKAAEAVDEICTNIEIRKSEGDYE